MAIINSLSKTDAKTICFKKRQPSYQRVAWRSVGYFPLWHTKEAQGKDGTSPKELSGFPGRTPRMMEIVHLSVKVTGINKSGNVLVRHFWKLWMHDQGEQNYDTVTAALHPCMRVFLPGSTTCLPPALSRSSFWLESFCGMLCSMLEKSELSKHAPPFPPNAASSLAPSAQTPRSAYGSQSRLVLTNIHNRPISVGTWNSEDKRSSWCEFISPARNLLPGGCWKDKSRPAAHRPRPAILMHWKPADNVSSGVCNSQADKRELSS